MDVCSRTLRRCALAVPKFSLHDRHWRGALAVFALQCFALAGSASAAAHQKDTGADTAYVNPTAGATYVGAETCKGCHAEIYDKSFANTPHAALLKQGKHGCEDCHGPGSEHVAGGGDKTKIIRFADMSPAEASKRCMGCHQANVENSDFAQSVHLSQGVGCLNCHSPHHATAPVALLMKPQTQLCYGCHAQQKAEFARPFRHRVDVGLIQCSDCHNPHGTFRDRQLREADGGMEVCNKCHFDKQGPFVFEHFVIKQDGCTACHTPHGSTNPRQLRVNQVNLLCLQCHTLDLTDNHLTPSPPAGPVHNQNTRFQACTMCHVQIHGSNFDEFFFK